jgi:cellulose synthase/poly-beta-1,6-N-acetylglucosamine synthase-like glycosyltransferase/Tol biopolymer transport system component
MTTPEIILAICHLALLTPLCVLGLHKAWMILLWWRRRQTKQEPATVTSADDSTLPRVTLQLPIYNERYVVTRLLDAVTALDYPRDRFEIQVLDDSTDDTREIIESHLRDLPADLHVHHVRRPDRSGFKAGALDHGLQSATGEFIAIFDADFVPRPDFLRGTIPQFANARVGLVQARWDHTNRDHSTLTQMQALLLDGHFAIEQRARAANNCFFNFNGTAGIFRRTCIEEAGGWQFDTLTEDMDLSYRAQLAGWEFVYLPELSCPAELPVDMNGFLTQQHRWAKGSIQTGRKLIGRIFAARVPLLTKIESVFHLFGNIAFPILLGLILVSMPLQLLRWYTGQHVSATLAWIEGMPLILATLSVFTYYGLSQATLRRFEARTLLRLPLVLVLGAGASLNNTIAVFSGLGRDPGVFERTPKVDAESEDERSHSYHSPRGILPLFELLLGAWASTTFSLAAMQGQWSAAVFHALFAFGFFWVGFRSWSSNRRFRALIPVAVLASCTGGSSEQTPFIAKDQNPEIVACRAQIDKEFALTEIVYATRNGLGLDDLPSRSGIESGVRVHVDGKRVVFARERLKDRRTSREIHISSIDNSVFDSRLTSNTAVDDGPCWSPDGKSILFSSERAGDRDLWRMDADGGNPVQFTSGAFIDRDPDWHKSGIVFSRTDPATAKARLFLTDSTGATPTPITDGGPGTGDFEPAWSPDGSAILFVRQLAVGRQILLKLQLGHVVPTPVGDGLGEDRFPRWSPSGDRIFVARNRPAKGIMGLRLFSMNPDGTQPAMIFPDQRFAYLGFDVLPTMRPYPKTEQDDTVVDIGAGSLDLLFGSLSRGLTREVLKLDDRVLGVRMKEFNGRMVGGVLLTLKLPVSNPDRIASLTIDVTGAITRPSQDSYIRLALRNFVLLRYDSAVEFAPADKNLLTWTFRSASLAHVSRTGEIRFEVIGDASGTNPVELLVDHIGVKLRLHAPE